MLKQEIAQVRQIAQRIVSDESSKISRDIEELRCAVNKLTAKQAVLEKGLAQLSKRKPHGGEMAIRPLPETRKTGTQTSKGE